jgi:GT2 family glycosyltransferase
VKVVDLIIPTWNNLGYLIPCLQSIFDTTLFDDYRILVVNNGEQEQMQYLKEDDHLKVLQQTRNMGWEGGLIKGLEYSSSPFVLFMNDDTLIPSHQREWLPKMLKHFSDTSVAAVGPTSNVVMGRQNIFIPSKEYLMKSKFLIGFCMMVRRSYLDECGGVDDTLPGGDDLDLSIRLRDLGKNLLIDRDVFVYHHGFKTGERVEGGPNQANGWNSIEKIEKINFGLINKHGIRKYLNLWGN